MKRTDIEGYKRTIEIKQIEILTLKEHIRKLRESCRIYDDIIQNQHNEIKELKKQIKL